MLTVEHEPDFVAEDMIKAVEYIKENESTL